MAGVEYTSKSVSGGILDLGGGLNSTTNSLSLLDNEMSELQNVIFDTFGSIKSRGGYDTLNDTTVAEEAACCGLYNAEFKSGTKFVGIFGDKFYKMEDLDGTWDEVTLSGVTVTSGANILMDFTMLDNLMLATNGTDLPMKWEGGTKSVAVADVPTGLTKAKYVDTWNNYAFYLNVTVSSVVRPSRWYYSNLKKPDTWEALDFVETGLDDGTEITGSHELGDRWVVFKDRSIWNIFFTGDSDIPFIQVQSQSAVGCVSNSSIQKAENGLIFLSQDGFYFYDGNNSIKISDKITRTLNTFEKGRFKYATSCYSNKTNTYWCSFTDDGEVENSNIITYNTSRLSFSVFTGIAANYLTTLYSNDDELIYFGDYDGFAYLAETGTNDNPLGVETAIESYFKTKWFPLIDIVNKKGVAHVVVYAQISQDSEISFKYSYDLESSDQFSQTIDLSTSSATYGSAIYGTDVYAEEGGKIFRLDLSGRGRVFRMHFYQNNLNQSFQIDAIGLYPHLETVS